MAILGIFTGDGFTKQMYEEIRKAVDWEHNKAKGQIFHSVGFDNSGNLRVVDMWDSEQNLNNFITNRIKPALDKMGVPMPNGEIIPIHNAVAFEGIDSYRIN